MTTTPGLNAKQIEKAIAFFLREAKENDDKVFHQRLNRDALNQAIEEGKEKQTQLIQKTSKELGLRCEDGICELLSYLQGDIYCDGDGKLFQLETNSQDFSIIFNPVRHHGERLSDRTVLSNTPLDRMEESEPVTVAVFQFDQQKKSQATKNHQINSTNLLRSKKSYLMRKFNWKIK